MNLRHLLALLVATLLPANVHPADWQRDVTRHGVIFTKVRTTADGLHIGHIDTETVIGGRACRPGWLHLHPDGTPAAFTAAHNIVLPRFTIPAGTWVQQDPSGIITVCSFPRDIIVQGHLCRGTGGAKGVQTAFFPSGALKQFFPARPTIIDEVPCGPGLTRGWVELHENGRLKSCLLGENWSNRGRQLRKGTRITLTPEGELRPD